MVDIVNDAVADHHYKETEDLTKFTSKVTGRGPLSSDWLENCDPVMCSYKSVEVNLDLYVFQTKLEEFIHKVQPTKLYYLLFDYLMFAFVSSRYEKSCSSDTDKPLPGSTTGTA